MGRKSATKICINPYCDSILPNSKTKIYCKKCGYINRVGYQKAFMKQRYKFKKLIKYIEKKYDIQDEHFKTF